MEPDLLNILWTIAFSMIVVTSVLGNTMVLWTVCGRFLLDNCRTAIVYLGFDLKYLAHRRMWSVTNYFLLNLTIADVMMATLNTIFSFIYMRDRFASDWGFGDDHPHLNTIFSLIYMRDRFVQGGRSCAKAWGAFAEKFGLGRKFQARTLRFVAIYSLFGDLWAKKCLYG